MESLGGLNDVSEKDEMKEEKVVNLDEEKKKRKPFWYWTVKGRDYRLKLKASTIGKLENKYRQNIMNLVEDMPSLSVMLTIIQAAMEPWEHGIDYPDIQKIYDSWTEEGGNQVDLFKKVVIHGGAGEPVKTTSEFLSELYPYALDAGISIDLFWNSSVNEIIDMLESYGRRKEQERKLKIQDDFIIAEVIALNILAPVAGDKEAMPHPWDYYPSFFEAEKKSWEENQLKQQMEDYKERRKAYIAEVNRRRQLGL